MDVEWIQILISISGISDLLPYPEPEIVKNIQLLLTYKKDETMFSKTHASVLKIF